MEYDCFSTRQVVGKSRVMGQIEERAVDLYLDFPSSKYVPYQQLEINDSFHDQ